MNSRLSISCHFSVFIHQSSQKIRLILIVLLLMPGSSYAQNKAITNRLKHQLALIDSAFKNNDTEKFNRLVGLESIRAAHALAITEKILKVPGKSRIISINSDSAYVMLSGLFVFGNSGDETNFSNSYTGIYKMEVINGVWQIKNRIEIDRVNQIKKQNIAANLLPRKGIKVSDTLMIDVNDKIGFAVRLNHKAHISKLLLNQTPTDFTFSGGLLWVNAPKKSKQQLIIDYAMDVEQDEEDKNSSYFGESYGHLRNQYYWHPFFNFSSPNDRAEFNLQCSIPKAYHLATSLPQKDRIVGDDRIITAKSGNPTFGLSIYYDKDWDVNTIKMGQIEMTVYAAKDFSPNNELLRNHFSKYYDTLQKHFGEPIGNYLAIVQDRSGGNGWKNRSNDMVVAGQSGSYLITDKPNPRAIFGHEVAHGWTSPTGPATNFLMEGWATYAESFMLSSVYGDSIVVKFFKSQKQNYLNGKYDGKRSLWDDYSNSGVSYSKGAWLFYILENQLGKEKLALTMRNFIASGKQTVQSFIAETSKVAGTNMESFLMSWLKSKEIPALRVQNVGSALKINQEGDVFMFPLEIQIKLKNGKNIDKKIDIKAKEQLVEVSEGEIESYVLDPNGRLLFNVKL